MAPIAFLLEPTKYHGEGKIFDCYIRKVLQLVEVIGKGLDLWCETVELVHITADGQYECILPITSFTGSYL